MASKKSPSKKTTKKKAAKAATKKTPSRSTRAAKKAPSKAAKKTPAKAARKAPANATNKNKQTSSRSTRLTKKAPSKRPATPSDSMSAPKRIDEMIASLGDWRGALLSELRKLIHEVDPDVVEDWKWMGTPVWSHDGMYVLANPHKDKVKITFHHGAQLSDPSKLFNNGLGGNKWRAIDLYEGDVIDTAALAGLLREAIVYNTTHSVPKSKGSRLRTRST